MVPKEPEASVVREMFRRSAQMVPKLDITLWAASQGLVTHTGKPLHLSGLHRMLTNPIYMGIIYKPEWNIVVQGDFEPLVDRETFELANHQIKKGGKRASSRTRNKTDFPLRRVVRCGLCDTSLTGSWSTGRQKSYACYHCRNRQCGKTRIRKADMEAAFKVFLEASNVDPTILDALKLTYDDMYAKMQASRSDEVDCLKRAMDDLAPREARLVELYVGDSGVTKELFQRQIQALENERIELQDQLASLRVDLLNSNEIFEKAKMLLSDLYASWNRLDPRQQLQFLHFLVPHDLVK
jgi:site-specific DNA recombinase